MKKSTTVKCYNNECVNLVHVPFREIEKVTNGTMMKFCSRSCSTKTTKNKKRTGYNKICKNCGDEFYAQKNQNSYQFCSHKCASKYKSGSPLLKKRRQVEKICLNCENIFFVQEHRKDSVKYCSIDCATIMSIDKWNSHKYNPLSIKIIEEFGKSHEYKFQHAENGGEYKIPGTRYFVDGYDKEKNTVIEYDEKHHFYSDGRQKNNDIIRQNDIINEIKCTFIRIRYDNKIITYDKTNTII